MLLEALKQQGYSFYRFGVIKEKPTLGWGKITPSPAPPRLGLNAIVALNYFENYHDLNSTPKGPNAYEIETQFLGRWLQNFVLLT